MGCCNQNNTLTAEQLYGVYPETPCAAITVDLLQIYKNMINCYLTYKLWEKINSSQAELEGAHSYLEGFIAQKMADPNDCEGIGSLILVRMLVDRIVKIGACL